MLGYSVLLAASLAGGSPDVGESHFLDVLALTDPEGIERLKNIFSVGCEALDPQQFLEQGQQSSGVSQYIYNDTYQWFSVQHDGKHCVVITAPMVRVLSAYEAAGLKVASSQEFPIPSSP